MPLSHVSKVFGVKDAKIAKLTADPAGGTPTYASSVDVPGMKTVTIGGEISTAELRGDHSRLDFQSTLSGIEVEFEYAKLSLDALAVMLGGSVVDAGTTPNQTATFGITSASALNYFRFQAVAVGADSVGGDVLFTIHKAILTEFPEMGSEEEDYKTFSTTAAAVPILGTGGAWMDVVLRETAVALT